MGGIPITALNLLAVPEGVLSADEIGAMLRGGQEILDEAECRLLGGHSIDDNEPKMGYSVTGLVHPDHIWRNSTAQAGDVLYLSKPIGTGVVIKAIKDGETSRDMMEDVLKVMITLNKEASDTIRLVGDPTACTDVTGFGLLGHAWEMAKGANVSMELLVSAIPVVSGARELARQDKFPSGSRRNLKYVAPHLTVSPQVDEFTLTLLADAVTSGGLLVTVKEENAASMETTFSRLEVPLYRIGRVFPGPARLKVSV